MWPRNKHNKMEKAGLVSMSFDAEQKLHETKTMLKNVLDELAKKKKLQTENLEHATLRSDEASMSKYRSVLREHEWFGSLLDKALRMIVP